jgi:hypothetical protein
VLCPQFLNGPVHLPRPCNIDTCMYYTGIDPFQRALMQFFKHEHYFMVREALLRAGRPYRKRVRLPDRGPAVQGGHRSPEAASQ